jgi:hypothetical protein
MTIYNITAQEVTRNSPFFTVQSISVNNGDHIKYTNDGRRTHLIIQGEAALDPTIIFQIPITAKHDGVASADLAIEPVYDANHKFNMFVIPLNVLIYGTDIDIAIDAAGAVALKVAVVQYS